MIIDNHSFSVNEKGHLKIGQLDAVDLAKEYGTPLYVYDVEKIRENCRTFVNTFRSLNVKAQVTYASKAFSSVAILQVIKQEGLSLDVVSAGELYTALKADFPVEKIHLHGNNKSKAEIEMAIENNIGCIIIDNFYEIELLEMLLEKHQKEIDVLIRVTPGIESETHQYIMTGNEDSKFGFNLQNGQAQKAFERLINHQRIKLKGLHSHIGSQIFTTKSFTLAVEILFELISEWKKEYNFIPEVMNFGGGFGIRYTKDDEPIPHKKHVSEIVKAVQKEVNKLQMALPEIWIEPGRSIVGNAGITLYTVGSMKEIPDVRDYVAIDGGMADNIRPALYEAKYDAVIANKVKMPVTKEVSIAGKCCESGDMLIWDLKVPEIEHNDILAVFSTGAYGYSMASNYNRFTRPAVVFVENGKSKLVVKRETVADIVKNDLSYL
ncbi:diaminopimelate decarboxylase [Pseudogracilibacillus sp. SE30717A]|uniref:diaminopimelate decarboxylase n=1 Tax=Pseudogracilibacillus sp. SE30717A TaxID=3098293 RepID=UPI00300DE416